MLQKCKKTLAVLLAVILLAGAFPAVSLAATSGSCGTNLSFTIINGVFRIYGSGTATKNYIQYSEVPWYSNRTQITSVQIDAPNLTRLGNYLFANMPNLTSITVPDTVTEIGAYVFDGSTGLQELHIPSGITSVDIRSFRYCDIDRVYVPSIEEIYNWNYIGTYAANAAESNLFNHAKAIYIEGSDTPVTEYTVPAQITEIRDYGFLGAPFTSVTIPAQVTAIGNSAFRGCDMTSLTIEDDGTNEISAIGNYAFADCTGLTSLVIPDCVTADGDDLGRNVFSGCTGITEARIGKGLSTMGRYMFSGDSALSNVYIYPTLTGIDYDATDSGCTALATGDVWYYGTKAQRNQSMTINMNGNEDAIVKNTCTWHFLQEIGVDRYFEKADGSGTYEEPVSATRAGFSGVDITQDMFADPASDMYFETPEGFTFSYADPASFHITEDAVLHVDLYYARAQYRIAFYAENGTDLLCEDNAYYGNVPAFTGTLPSKEETAAASYTLYWRAVIDGVEGERYLPGALPAASEAVNYIAEFASSPKTYAVSVTAAEGITLTETPASPAPYGEAAVKFTVDAGYNAENLLVAVNGEPVSPALADGIYTVALFIEGQTNVNIEFAVSSFTLTAKNGYNDAVVTYTGAEGETAAVAYPARDGYVFTGWTGDTANLNGTVYTFPAANEEIIATWLNRAAADAAVTAADAVANNTAYDAEYRDSVADKRDELVEALAQVPASGSDIETLTAELNALISAENLAENTLYTLTVAYGYASAANTAITKKAGETATIAYPAREGYVFTGWAGDTANLNGTVYTFPAANEEITASWYNTAAASGAISNAETLSNGDYDTVYKEEVANAADALNNALNTVPANSGDIENALGDLNALIGQADSHLLTIYSVTLSFNGGTYLGEDEDITLTYTAQSEPFALPEAVTKEDCDFAGWYDGDGNKFTAIDPALTQEDMLLTARWTLSAAAVENAISSAEALISDEDNVYCDSLSEALSPLIQQLTEATNASPRDEDRVNALYSALLAQIAAKDDHKHVWSDWTVTVQADYGVDGTKERFCSTCGDVQTRSYSLNATPDREIHFHVMARMHYILDIGTNGYVIYYNDSIDWYSEKELRFCVYAYTNFAYESYIVYIDGVAVEPDADGWYTVPAGESRAVVSIVGASYDQDTGKKTSFWEWLLKLIESIKSFLSSIFSK